MLHLPAHFEPWNLHIGARMALQTKWFDHVIRLQRIARVAHHERLNESENIEFG
jgi:hypothetical protein